MLSLDQDLVIDARLKANQARFANHSCDPNCVTQVSMPRLNCMLNSLMTARLMTSTEVER